MPADASVAAIIVTHNRAEWLRRSVRSVLAQQPTAPTLIVVDNGSTDHTTQVLRQECPDATVIRLAENTGCAVGSNIGAAAAPHELLFFLDDDSELAPDAIASARQVLQADERTGAVTGAVIEGGQPIRVTATPGPSFINVCHSQGGFRKSAFLAAGMYPSGFFYGAEEMALSLRMLEAGFDIVYDPAVVVFHGADPHSRRRHGVVEINRNMLRIVLMRAPFVLLVPWAVKKLLDTVMAAVRSGDVRAIAAEVLTLPGTIMGSLWRRRPVPWKVFAAFRYLGTREVRCRDYRDRALLEYPNQFELLRGYLRTPSAAGSHSS